LIAFTFGISAASSSTRSFGMSMIERDGML